MRVEGNRIGMVNGRQARKHAERRTTEEHATNDDGENSAEAVPFDRSARASSFDSVNARQHSHTLALRR